MVLEQQTEEVSRPTAVMSIKVLNPVSLKEKHVGIYSSNRKTMAHFPPLYYRYFRTISGRSLLTGNTHLECVRGLKIFGQKIKVLK